MTAPDKPDRSPDGKPLRVLLTGGGSAGHVTPNLALIEALHRRGHRLDYVGQAAGIEAQLVANAPVAFHAIAAGKLRRYFSWQNLTDAGRVAYGCVQAALLLRRLRPDVVFSKGGFVSVPVAVGAWLNRVPLICHESDRSPGLANRIAGRFAQLVCTSFSDTVVAGVAADRHVHTGAPLRPALLSGDALAGRRWLATQGAAPAVNKPLLLVVGGSLGARRINEVVRAALEALTERFDVAHICGANQCDAGLQRRPGYWQFEYLDEPFGDVLAAADLVLSRAGANALYELLSLAKPALLVPLPAAVSRGDQIENAAWAVARGYCRQLDEAKLSAAALEQEVDRVWRERRVLADAMAGFAQPDAVTRLCGLIERIGRSDGSVTPGIVER